MDEEVRLIVDKRIDRLIMGNSGDCKKIKNVPDIWEIRIDFGPGYRIYFGKRSNFIVLLLIGGTKKSQINDIKKAQEYWLDFLREYNEKSNTLS